MNKVCIPPNPVTVATPRVNRYFKLPFRGKDSKLVKQKIAELCEKYCEATMLKIVFTSTKLSSFLSPKDPIPSEHKSHVVYKFTCPGCNARYIGETTRHYRVRCEEHVEGKDKTSTVWNHLSMNRKCKRLITGPAECFRIIDQAPSQYQLELKEALHIGWENPVLNKQVKHQSISLNM